MNATGPETIRLLPPLTVSDDEIDEAVRGSAALSRRERSPDRVPRRMAGERHTLIKTASYEAEPDEVGACCCSTRAGSTRA